MFVQIDTSWFYICACGCWYQGFSGFLIDDGQLYEAWRAIAAKQRLRTKWRPSWRWCRVGHELFISDLLYSFSFSLWVLDFHHMTKAFESISGGVVFFSVCIIPKHQREGFLSSQISTSCSTILEVWSIPFTRKISTLVKISISLCSCWRHFLSVKMSSALKRFAKPLSPIPSAFYFLSNVIVLISPFTAPQNLCWFEM